MRCTTAPLSLVAATSLVSLSTNAFILEAPLHDALVFSHRRGSRINAIRSAADCSCVDERVSSARTRVWGRVVTGGVGESDIFPSSWRSKRTCLAATRPSGASNDGRWEPLTPNVVSWLPPRCCWLDLRGYHDCRRCSTA